MTCGDEPLRSDLNLPKAFWQSQIPFISAITSTQQKASASQPVIKKDYGTSLSRVLEGCLCDQVLTVRVALNRAATGGALT